MSVRPGQLSEHSAGARPRIVVSAANHDYRVIAGTLLGLAVPWLIYTRLYFWLQPRGLTFSSGLMASNIPGPACGLTRTFAWMWRGDLQHAVSVYPLGPLAFAAAIGIIIWSLSVLVLGRAAWVRLSRREWTALAAVAVIALLLNWTAKLLWLGM